ncbi:GTP cyclohydrolase 1 type 2/Nif3 [Lipomyces arxii]|uniref:GTP cyclohydrolase 1 type 2/Nif3 n=1 Tax=Lipomyces arxii TaxID=56418 RepID=UPI0034CFF3EB
MSKTLTAKATTKVVKNLISTVQQLFPVALADDTWDNTGLLLESPALPSDAKARVLLTIDLTTAVATEAVQKKALLVVAYHPIIFRPLKAITTANTQQMSLLRLVQAGISVYSPHTAVDAQEGGMNDWLALVAAGEQPFKSTVLQPSKTDSLGKTGFGRLVTLDNAVTVERIIANIKQGLKLSYIQVALADRHKEVSTASISTIALCAGSGGSVLAKADADLWFTGELSHHEVLALVERGISAVICGHTNTERGYLSSTFAPFLNETIAANVAAAPDYYENADIEILVSETDRNPVTYF